MAYFASRQRTCEQLASSCEPMIVIGRYSEPSLQLTRSSQSGVDGFEWKKERERRVPQRDSAITGVPSSNAFTLSINQQGNSARLRRYSQTPSSCRKQELATEALSLEGDIYG